MEKLTIELAKQIFDYDKNSGVIKWKVNRSWVKAGTVCGYIGGNGYRYINILGKMTLAHRLAWFIEHEEWPSDQIDHINGVKDDNKMSNLRVVTRGINQQNLKNAKAHNKSGFLGVFYSSKDKKYIAKIRTNGKSKTIGYFKSAEEAHQAYLNAKRCVHAGCTI